MQIRKITVVLLLLLALVTPLMAQGAREKMEELEKEEQIEVVETENTVSPSKEEKTAVPAFATVDFDSLESRFSYSYGYMITFSLLQSGVSINGGYWLKGTIDGYNYAADTFLVSTDEMDADINDYINNYYNAGMTGEAGSLLTLDELNSLSAPESVLDKFSYSYSLVYIVQLYWMNGLDISLNEFLQGSAEALYLDAPLYMTTDEMDSAISEYATVLNEEYEAYIANLSASNLEEAETFLSENENNEGIIKLESGNLMEITAEDEELGATPLSTDSVIVDYDLFLLDGTQIDSGSDVTFSLSSLIPGFVEAVENMKVGQECYVYIHPDYGYGENGTTSIEPNSLLIFRIYLKGIATTEAEV